MADPEAIYNWRRLDKPDHDVRSADRKAARGHSYLRRAPHCELGLHPHEKSLPDEAASVARLGMTYIHIPVDFQNPTDQNFD